MGGQLLAEVELADSMPNRTPRSRRAMSRQKESMTGIAQSDSSRVATHVTTAAEHPEISYGDALNQGLRQAMEISDSVIVLDSSWTRSRGSFGSTTGWWRLRSRARSRLSRCPRAP